MPRLDTGFVITKKYTLKINPVALDRKENKKSVHTHKGVFFNFSLHNSLSQEVKLRDDFNNTLENIETQVKQRDNVIDVVCV